MYVCWFTGADFENCYEDTVDKDVCITLVDKYLNAVVCILNDVDLQIEQGMFVCIESN